MAQYTIKKAFKYINIKDICNVMIAVLVLPFALIAKIFIRDFWLVCEDKNEARDNGYWFYKWVRENHPEQKIAYAINKKSPDYAKVKDLGKTISFGSVAHWFWYIVADKNISSQKGGKPNAAVCYLFEVVLGLRKNNRIFLQHGVTINKGNWLFYPNTKFRLFITATKQEQEYIAENFGYPPENLALLGFSRFDRLHNIEVDKDMILLMPTWRNWLGRESSDNKHLEFIQTEYFKRWNEIITSQTLIDILAKYNKRLLFYPHRNMQKFLGCFKSKDDRIEVADWKDYDVQESLKKAALLITDYSSVFFDFSYMRKPVLFYQFDEKEFREKQYEEGYFNYRDTVLGKWTDNAPQLFENIEEQLKKDCALMEEDTIKTIFPYWDTENSMRIYNKIKSL